MVPFFSEYYAEMIQNPVILQAESFMLIVHNIIKTRFPTSSDH